MLEYSISVKLLTEHHLEFLTLKGGCTGASESTLVKMPHYWKSNVAAALLLLSQGSHRLEKCLNIQDSLEKSLKIKSALISNGKSLKGLEKSLNSSFFCRT